MVIKCLICDVPMIWYPEGTVVCTHCDTAHPGLIARLRREVLKELDAEEREALRRQKILDRRAQLRTT